MKILTYGNARCLAKSAQNHVRFFWLGNTADSASHNSGSPIATECDVPERHCSTSTKISRPRASDGSTDTRIGTLEYTEGPHEVIPVPESGTIPVAVNASTETSQQ